MHGFWGGPDDMHYEKLYCRGNALLVASDNLIRNVLPVRGTPRAPHSSPHFVSASGWGFTEWHSKGFVRVHAVSEKRLHALRPRGENKPPRPNHALPRPAHAGSHPLPGRPASTPRAGSAPAFPAAFPAASKSSSAAQNCTNS